MNRTDSIAKISVALLKAQREMGNAVKDTKNPFFKSSYATLNSVREAVMPALNANGIALLQPMIVVDGKAIVETILIHESGETMSSYTPVICDKENNAQSQGSGISYSRRYGLQSFLSIGSDDDNGNAASGLTTPKPTAKVVKQEVSPKQDETPKVEFKGEEQAKAITEGSDTPKKAKPSFNKKTVVKADAKKEEEW